MDDELRKKFTEEAQAIIKSRYKFIGRNYIKIRDAYNEFYNDPELDPLRHEICLCIFFGLHQAAITLTNHFFESLMKYALITFDAIEEKRKGKKKTDDKISLPKSLVKDFEQAKKKHGGSNLGDNINKACSRGLITKEQKEILHQLRDEFRNAFGHSDKDKTFGDAKMPVQGISLDGDKLLVQPPEEVEIAQFLIGQGLIQAMQAEHEAPDYFLYIHEIAKQIVGKLFGDIQKL
ncbi:MAG: DUF4145 domain-containing protein [Ignavibacteriae bacterium]|nr:DUF4145 domain-containing protein [Ignavibacteriota bacterium]